MNTLSEIEAAIERLSREDQAALLEHLQARLGPPNVPSAEARQQWMDRLERLRDSIATGNNNGPSTEEILDELREERG